jgi:GWxTD domain-containing protein
LNRFLAVTLFMFPIVVAGVAAGAAHAGASASARADSLHRSASLHLATGTVDARRIAIEELDQAMRLDPDNPDRAGALGRACLEAGSDHRALAAFRRVLELDPRDPEAHLGLAQTWKREWLANFEPSYLDSARGHAEAALALRPDGCADRVLAALLAYEKGAMPRAIELGWPAYAACPERYDAGLLSAELAWRTGSAALADSLFAAWIPRLPEVLRERFQQTTPLLTEADAYRIEGLSSDAQIESLRRFWSRSDPDPTTDRNEARLEYWARVAHASLLFMDLDRPRWDIRGELYSRYGAPNALQYEPMGYPLAARHNYFDNWYGDVLNGMRRIGEPLWVPLHSMVLEYPELGMRVLLHDQFLTGNFDAPRGRYGSNDPVPADAALARPDLVATPGGRSVFPLHPPGVEVIPIAASLFDFADARGPRLIAQVEAVGGPDDSLVAEAVVIDSTEHVIARTSHPLAPSACDPATLRGVEFDFALPPGPHRVAFAVRGRDRARGLARLVHMVEATPEVLAMSDVVMTCGSPADMVSEAGIRLQPNVAREVAGEGPLTAYFEVYHLASEPSGATRFEYRYTIRPEGQAHRSWIRRLFSGGSDAGTVVRSQSEGRDATRRQFLVAPVRSLTAGRYMLEVEVHDLIAGTRTVRSTRFVRT